jgi:uroporphyrinogen-III synthase
VKLLILRPEPGASETAARARELGLDPIVAPLFEIRGVQAGPVNAADYDAVLLTSANGARHAPPGLTGLPCFAVGEGTAAAARQSGFADVRVGPADGASAAAMTAAAGMKRVLHPCGREHLPVTAAGVAIERRVVYSAEPTAPQPFEGPAVAMIHSPRAGRRFAELAGDKSSIVVAAISAAAAEAAGAGWAATRVAAAPRDQALLELAAKLCNTGGEATRDRGDGL